jgi:hypothetical protein
MIFFESEFDFGDYSDPAPNLGPVFIQKSHKLPKFTFILSYKKS